MSLYGALFSGVSGLSSQASAMGAISDNVTNVNTVGYKGTKVNFQTLITQQVSLTKYSPGGVQSKPRAQIDVQGLLQSTSSSTDIGMSGQGFFVVNSVADPSTASGGFFGYTRAGSFKADKQGYLQNSSGFYLQGWPLIRASSSAPASSIVTIEDTNYMKSYINTDGSYHYINSNIVSPQETKALNLNTIGGTATATASIRMGANLPSGDPVYDFTSPDNGGQHQSSILIYDSLGNPHNTDFTWTKSATNNWKVEAAPPPSATTITSQYVDGSGNTTNYWSESQLEFVGEFSSAALSGLNGDTIRISWGDTPTNYTFTFDNTIATSTATNIALSGCNSWGDVTQRIMDSIDLNSFSEVTDLGANVVTCTSVAGATAVLTSTNANQFNNLRAGDLITISGGDANIPDGTYCVAADTVAGAGTVTLEDSGSLFTVSATQPAGLDINNASYVGYEANAGRIYRDGASTNRIRVRQFAAPVAGGVISGNGAQSAITISTATDTTGDGLSLYLQQYSQCSSTSSYGVDVLTEGSNFYDQSSIVFNGNGTPDTINVNTLQIKWANGAEAMDGSTTISPKVDLFLGNTDLADGMTQLSGSYQVTYITQDGAKFGNFSGVSIGDDGVVTALFDNGVRRPVFQIPVSTFVNPNGLQALTGNTFIETDTSGAYTLRTAKEAGAGSISAAALEASTVDLGEEFSNMIITQRAYSASAKIITTADQMLDELVNIKR
jgi:flagellar hook protein FlgE